MAKNRSPLTSEQIQRELFLTRKNLPIVSQLKDLFRDSKMFESFRRFEDEGFDMIDHSENKMMSGSHKRAKGYLFKKYNNAKSGKDQIANYMRRIEGSRLLRRFIKENNFKHVIAPRKWLYELPSSFPQRYLLVAEKIPLISRNDTYDAYKDIGKDQMRELATILFYFRGLNSTAANLPYTKDGKIAFIDTERWHHDKDYLSKVGDRLSSKRSALAEEIYDDLKKRGKKPFQSSFK